MPDVAFDLAPDEKVIGSWQGIREVLGKTFEVSLEQKDKKRVQTRERKEGLLVLTNQRLLFLEGLGTDGKRLGEAVKVSLIDVDKLWFEKAPIKTVGEAEGFETYVFSLKKVGKKKEFDAFKKLVDEYCRKRKEEIANERRKVVRFKVG